MVEAEAEQLLHIVQLDLRDAGLQELDVRCLSKLEQLRCDRNSLWFLRVAGHALKSLHAAHNGTEVTAETFNERRLRLRPHSRCVCAFRAEAAGGAACAGESDCCGSVQV